MSDKDVADHIRAAEHALSESRFYDAYQELDAAEQLGSTMSNTHAPDIKRLRNAIREAEDARAHDSGNSHWVGMAAGVACYILLGFRTPLGWTKPIWALLAFLVIPVIVGYATGHRGGEGRARATKLKSGFFAGAVAMFLYTAVNITISRSQIASDGGPDGGGEVFAGFIVSLVYSIIAGVIAALAGATAHEPHKEHGHGHIS